jgi:hypothetical protein
VRATAPSDFYGSEADVKGKNVMNAAQIKDELRRLNRSEKIEIFRWLDREVGDDLIFRNGMHRSLQIRQQLEPLAYCSPRTYRTSTHPFALL